jgi:hypothetical protein
MLVFEETAQEVYIPEIGETGEEDRNFLQHKDLRHRGFLQRVRSNFKTEVLKCARLLKLRKSPPLVVVMY